MVATLTTPNERSKARRITVFNHKGGVGKTTLTMNVAASLAELGRRVLLVDSDPQCNLTSYLVADEVVDDLLDNSDGASGRTVWSAVKPISEAAGTFKRVAPIEPGITGLFLIPGDIRLSEFETDLGEFWAQCLQRKMRGFRGTTALSELVNHISWELNIDYVFYDSGPNIGPLNRVILLDCDHFVVPVACDQFSLRALKTLGRTLVAWISDWSTIAALAPEASYLLPGQPSFIGYVPEGFKVYGGAIASEHSHYVSRIEREIQSQVVAVLRKLDSKLAPGRMQQFKLGEIKNFGSLVPASQRQGRPIYAVETGSQQQRDEAHRALQSLARKIDERVSSARS
ncbi:MAG: ParA family protein [Gemmatimonadaceae bacterium]